MTNGLSFAPLLLMLSSNIIVRNPHCVPWLSLSLAAICTLMQKMLQKVDKKKLEKEDISLSSGIKTLLIHPLKKFVMIGLSHFRAEVFYRTETELILNKNDMCLLVADIAMFKQKTSHFMVTDRKSHSSRINRENKSIYAIQLEPKVPLRLDGLRRPRRFGGEANFAYNSSFESFLALKYPKSSFCVFKLRESSLPPFESRRYLKSPRLPYLCSVFPFRLKSTSSLINLLGRNSSRDPTRCLFRFLSSVPFNSSWKFFGGKLRGEESFRSDHSDIPWKYFVFEFNSRSGAATLENGVSEVGNGFAAPVVGVVAFDLIVTLKNDFFVGSISSSLESFDERDSLPNLSDKLSQSDGFSIGPYKSTNFQYSHRLIATDNKFINGALTFIHLFCFSCVFNFPSNYFTIGNILYSLFITLFVKSLIRLLKLLENKLLNSVYQTPNVPFRQRVLDCLLNCRLFLIDELFVDQSALIDIVLIEDYKPTDEYSGNSDNLKILYLLRNIGGGKVDEYLDASSESGVTLFVQAISEQTRDVTR
ncbi:hypothetical protein Bhyg_11560 [Pseudolycoriella hygida]|uniref:Uncharacterized protein n=1 Tax=Pseudolycoriella hygida TaxID=35572 RepID=A0A9Q0RZP9_9DIPT|nr:hypothetical protein Bhyg_11560 [Pseudolycoriella hygida]